MQILTLFVSSPGDVRDERQAVGKIVEKLQVRYRNVIRLEPVLREEEPLPATARSNEELIQPAKCDLFVGILGSSQPHRKDSATELEETTRAFEDRATAKPEILIYRRRPSPRKKRDASSERFLSNEDKTLRRVSSPYGTIAEFASLFEQHLEKLILRHIRFQRGPSQDALRPLPLEGSPFKGLATFEFEDAPLFFGRNRPVSEALHQLKQNHAAGHAFLLIYGGSGSGKSSLMKAGLAPRLMADGYLPEVGAWCGCGLQPVEGDAPPLETLARALVEALPDLAKLRDTSPAAPPASAPAPKGTRGKKPPAAPATLAAPVWDSARLARTLGTPEELPFAIAAIVAALDRTSAGKPAQLLILVDQLEEIFTARDVTPEMRAAWFHVLAALAMSRRIWVIATMRGDFFPRVAEHRDFFELVRHGGGYILGPPRLPELHQIIRYPALSAGLQFELHPQTGRDLFEQIYQDAAAEADDVLPLLGFTLEELYQHRRGAVLPWSAYEELGGLAGAIANRARETYDRLPSETRGEAAHCIFSELVTLDAGKAVPPTSRRASRQILHDAHPGAPAFLDAFIGAKLLVTGVENDTAVAALAHETLITRWPALTQWIEDHRDLLPARPDFEKSDLAKAPRVVSSGAFHLTPDEEELARLSRVRARRKLRLFQGATIVFAGLAVAASVLGLTARQKQQQAEMARGEAAASAAGTRRTLAAADFDAGAARVAQGSPDEALPHLLAALESNPLDLDAQALLLETLRHTAWNFPELQLRHPLPVRMLSFGEDRDTLFAATDSGSGGGGFNTILRWDLQTTAISSMLAPHWGESTFTLSASPGGKRLILQRDRKFPGDAFLCDTGTMRVIARLPVTRAHRIPATCFAWSQDGLLLAYPARTPDDDPASSSSAWRIIDTNRGKTLRESDPILPAAAAPLAAQLDSTRLRVVSADGSLFEMPVHPAAPALHGKPLRSSLDFAIFSPDGGQLLAVPRRDDRESPSTDVYSITTKPGQMELELQSAGFAADDSWTSSAALMERFPWARGESRVWDGIGDARDGNLPLRAAGSRLEVVDITGVDHAPRAPIRAESRIESAAFSGSRIAIGTASGMLSIHEVLPRIGHGFSSIAPQPDTDQEKAGHSSPDEGWPTTGPGDISDLQHRGHDWRLRGKDGKIVSLRTHPDWMYPEYVVRSSDESFVVQGGYGTGSGGFSFSGMVLVDPATGAVVGDLEPVDEIRGMTFLGDSHRVAAIGATGVIIAEVAKDGFQRIASLPVVDALSLYHLASRDWLAVATAKEIHLFAESDFSRVATLPVGASDHPGDWNSSFHDWAEDPTRGWLAYRCDDRLDLWSLRNRRALVSGLSLQGGSASRALGMKFVESDNLLSLSLGEKTAIPLVRLSGLDPTRISELRTFAQAVAGTGFATDSRSLVTYSAARRQELAASVDRAAVEVLLPGASTLLDRIASLSPRESQPEAWLPVWDRLSLGGKNDSAIARWAADLGPRHPWYQPYLRGLVAASDTRLYAWQRGELAPGAEDGDAPDPLPDDHDITTYHRLVADPSDLGDLKHAAWLALRTDPARLGKALVEGTEKNEFPDLDLKAVAQLDPAALQTMRTGLKDGETRDWRRIALDELPARTAALEKLEARITSTFAAFEREASPANAIAHAEALALRGQVTDAAKFLGGKIPPDAVLDLAQAHFLIASRLAPVAASAIDRALDAVESPWLWKAWLEQPGEGDLKSRVERAMTAVEGRGPAALASLGAALAAQDPAAIASALSLAKDLPAPAREYATARALWAEGKQAAVFALWPSGPPDFQALKDSGDWNGWEAAVSWKETHAFTRLLDERLATLKAAPEATVEDLRTLAARLLDPATAATFGIKRVRDAMVACGLTLAYDAESASLVLSMIERARLAGAPNADCLRMEGRSAMATGEFTYACSRWLLLLDTGQKQLIPQDYLEAARCLVEDVQPAAAIELLDRGKKHFPADPGYALNAAWLLLTNNQPEESGVLLEHGFTIPFPEDQKQVTLAMLVCAAEQTLRIDRADEAFAELVALSAEWASEESINGLDWPEELKQSLIAVAKRAAGEPPPVAIPVPEDE